MNNQVTLKAEQEAFFGKQDADNAEYAFNCYINEGPGVKAKEVLASLGDGARNEAFWNAALYRAKSVRKEWLSA